FRGIVIIHVAGLIGSGGARNNSVNSVLVRPRCVAASGVDHAVNRVSADEVPGINRLAAVKRIAFELVGINGFHSAVNGGVSGKAAVELRLVDFNAFLVFGLRPVDLSLEAASGRQSVACSNLRW